jgi:hypothetical protein
MLTRPIAIALIAVAAISCLGYWLQRDVPSEKLRIRHPQAYSVCCPQGWSADFMAGGGTPGGPQDSIVLTPDHFDGRPPRLEVNRLVSKPDLPGREAAGWGDGTFQGEPALLLDKQLTHGWVRAALFERWGQWFDLKEQLSVAATAQLEKWWRYLKTFRYPDGALPIKRPNPASAPAATTAPFQFPTMDQ